MRAMKKENDKWAKESPEDLSMWMWRNDGEDAVIVDDTTETYYCGNSALVETYRERWVGEGRSGDNRKAAMFIDLDRLLFGKGF